MMTTILEVLIQASEKAAAVARSCYHKDNDLQVAEKCGEEANTQFDTDFKTVADILAQESAKNEIATHFPELAKHVRGEEYSEVNGVCVKLQETSEETAELLSSLMSPTAAKRMASAAHTKAKIILRDLIEDLEDINVADLGVWIDPIDATSEFIAGVRGQADAKRALTYVTVLVGAYSRSSGEPVIGVINQPFFTNRGGRITWGINYGDIRAYGSTYMEIKSPTNIVLMSAAEKPDNKKKVESSGWEVKSLPGAGHKLMCVVLGLASAYIVSKGTTFRRDTCAPHAILKAKGGDILPYTNHSPITYNVPENTDIQQYCNWEGLIAYTDKNVFDKIKDILD